MGRVSPKGVLLKPPREQILQNSVRFMCEKPHIQTRPLYECRSTTSFEPITSQDCSTHTLYCRSAHSSYVRPDELKEGAWLRFSEYWGAERSLSPALGRLLPVLQLNARSCCPPADEPPAAPGTAAAPPLPAAGGAGAASPRLAGRERPLGRQRL